jgi:hypothetical protein
VNDSLNLPLWVGGVGFVVGFFALWGGLLAWVWWSPDGWKTALTGVLLMVLSGIVIDYGNFIRRGGRR